MVSLPLCQIDPHSLTAVSDGRYCITSRPRAQTDGQSDGARFLNLALGNQDGQGVEACLVGNGDPRERNGTSRGAW